MSEPARSRDQIIAERTAAVDDRHVLRELAEEFNAGEDVEDDVDIDVGHDTSWTPSPLDASNLRITTDTTLAGTITLSGTVVREDGFDVSMPVDGEVQISKYVDAASESDNALHAVVQLENELADARTQLAEARLEIETLRMDVAYRATALAGLQDEHAQLQATSDAHAALASTHAERLAHVNASTLWDVAWQGGRAMVAAPTIEEAIAKMVNATAGQPIREVKASGIKIIV